MKMMPSVKDGDEMGGLDWVWRKKRMEPISFLFCGRPWEYIEISLFPIKYARR